MSEKEIVVFIVMFWVILLWWVPKYVKHLVNTYMQKIK